MKIPIFDSNFISNEPFNGSSVHNPPKLLQWVDCNKNLKECENILKDRTIPLFITDSYLLKNLRIRNDIKKVAWLVEPKAISPRLYEDNFTDFISKNYNYVLTHEQYLIERYSNFLYVPFCADFTVRKETLPIKEKLVSYITSSKGMTEGHQFRLKTANTVKGYDLFGRGFRDIQTKNEALEPYMFSVAIENSISNYYFTEKLMDCFSTKTIPIYRGCDVSKWFNTDGIICFKTHEELQDIINNKLSKEFYESKLSAIEENFHKARNDYSSPEDFIVKQYPFLFQ